MVKIRGYTWLEHALPNSPGMTAVIDTELSPHYGRCSAVVSRQPGYPNGFLSLLTDRPRQECGYLTSRHHGSFPSHV
jgi:hypothetical protein